MKNTMSNELFQALQKPPIYTKSKAAFWNDEYISKQMLDSHLDPEFDGASRKHRYIERSAAWIAELIPSSEYPTLLDIGCGPGIYAEKFTKAGYRVTGVDFSTRSIQYAKESALKNNLSIQYLYQNYLEMDLKEEFDFCTMIYCDYGALSTDDRKLLLSKVSQHLKPGGKFLFDVFTTNYLKDYKEGQTWQYCPSGGFWRGDEYIELNGNYKYGDHVALQFVCVISEEGIVPYYIWDTYFTKESLIEEATNAGFKTCKIFGGIAGEELNNESKTMSILLEK